MIAADVMTENPTTIRQTDPISEAIDALQSLAIRHLPVVDDANNLVGMLSDRDLGSLMRTFAEEADAEGMVLPLSQRRVADYMSADVVSVEEDTDVSEVIETMLEQRIGALPVVDGEGNVKGIISYVDLLRAMVMRAMVNETRPSGPRPATSSAEGRAG
jgi:CBS domain-containing protein